MIRVKNSSRKSHNKILSAAKGFKGAHSKLFKIANQQVMRSWRYSYTGRKLKKRWFRSLWISRINIASRKSGSSYSQVINVLKNKGCGLNRKMLSQIANLDPKAWAFLVTDNVIQNKTKGVEEE